MFAVVPDLGAEPILPEKWMREPAIDQSAELRRAKMGSRSARFTVREDGVLVRIGAAGRIFPGPSSREAPPAVVFSK